MKHAMTKLRALASTSWNSRACLGVCSAAALLAGCAAAPPTWTESDRVKIRKVVIAVADYPPAVAVNATTAPTGTPLARVQDAFAEDMKQRLPKISLRAPLVAALQRELSAFELEATVLPPSEVRRSAAPAPAYSVPSERGEAVILEVAELNLGMTYASSGNLVIEHGNNQMSSALRVTAKIRVIDPVDRREMLVYRASASSGYSSIDDWMALRGGPMDLAIDQFARDLAGGIASSLVAYAPPEPEEYLGPLERGYVGTGDMATPEPLIFPSHSLRPVNPKLDGGFFNNPPRPAKADSLRPTLEWERFPRPYTWAPENSAAARITDVTYDLRLYRAIRRYVAGGKDTHHRESKIYERVGLVEPAHRPDIELQACTPYFWTIRARFRLDGRVRVSGWTTIRRSGLPGFVTPARPGKEGECSHGN